MIPSLQMGNLPMEDSDRRVSAYIAQLFAQGDFDDVIAISQQELSSHPENLDLVVYRACAILILQVSGTVRRNETLLHQAMSHLNTIIDLMHHTDDTYDDSLDFYLALGHLALGKFDEADRLFTFIEPILHEEQEALDYYESRKSYWKAKQTMPTRAQATHLTFFS